MLPGQSLHLVDDQSVFLSAETVTAAFLEPYEERRISVDSAAIGAFLRVCPAFGTTRDRDHRGRQCN